ncbi:uncharacterized protein LOC143695417 isoform X3 [Agelaius phoeniceus]|uniref:uncharacterized protein LOC143695417 isoform X3 n=1 Tax=Agelaius phoeniceus TaxID=39638 RepID=UPI004054D14E
MGFVDGHKISGALKLSCNSLTLVLTFFSDSDGLNPCQRAPSRVRGFPRAGSQGREQQSRPSGRGGPLAIYPSRAYPCQVLSLP